jgi:hypothetical protein
MQRLLFLPKITLIADRCEATITCGPLPWSIYLFRRIEQLITLLGEATKQQHTVYSLDWSIAGYLGQYCA